MAIDTDVNVYADNDIGIDTDIDNDNEGFDKDIDVKTVYSVEEIKKRLEPVFRANNVRKAILYGSYAKNCADRKSDVDLLVDSDLRGLSFYGLAGDARTALAKEIHMYELYYIKEARPVNKEAAQMIEKEIMKTGITIYEG